MNSINFKVTNEILIKIQEYLKFLELQELRRKKIERVKQNIHG